MELRDLYSMMDRFAASGLTALEWQRQGETLVLRREGTATTVPPSAPPAPAPAETETGETVTAPLVGVFYAAPGPEDPPFAPVGARVGKGEPLCLIEAMKMMSEVPAPADCVVEEVLAKNGEAVGRGAPLFRIRRV